MITVKRIPIIARPQGYYFRWYYNGWHYWQFYPGSLSYKTEGEKYRTFGSRFITVSSGPINQTQSDAIRTILSTTEVYLYTDSGWMTVRIESGVAGIKNNITQSYEVTFKALIGSRVISVTGFSPVVDVPVIPPDDLCEVVVGTQIWMCRNWYANYPGSKVYNNDEANRDLYGGLYTFNQINNAGFCPDGWHVPTEAEWQTLIDFIGGETNAGTKLKEAGTTYWNTIGGTDDYNFKARGGGYVDPFGVFSNLKNIGYFWTKTMSSVYGKAALMVHDQTTVLLDSIPPSVFASVRLMKDTAPTPFDDYYLPSLLELGKMHDILHLFGVGGFNNAVYHSSSEGNLYNNWIQNFTDGSISQGAKTDLYDVRACRSFISTTIYALRDTGPAGGLIFHIIDNGGGSFTYFEASPSNLSSGYLWSNVYPLLLGGTSQNIGTGQNNTTLIINQVGHTDSAAKLCNDLITYA